MGWAVRRSNPGGGQDFPHSSRPGHAGKTRKTPPGCFPRVEGPGRGLDHPTLSNAEVKERVELNLYSHSGPSWPVKG